jgi:DNA helicase IV
VHRRRIRRQVPDNVTVGVVSADAPPPDGGHSANGVTREVVEREIASEQRYVDRVHQRLEASVAAARELEREGYRRSGMGHEGGLVERDAMVYQAARRIAALDAAREGLVFGRLDLVDGEARYIGRIGVRDEHREPLLVDWRAPAASVFYRATPSEPMGSVRRRVLRCVGDKVVAVEDDLIDADAAPKDLVVVGEGALLAELSRARGARMHSVVATIQREQDDVIRSPVRGVTSISGGPGTGKTVVALHRVAYLLYSDRRRFETGGVLVVGPSAVFMSYIERVLPSLGETSVALRSLGEVVDGVSAGRHDSPAVAALKGSMRMRRVLSRAARDAVPGAPEEFRTFYRDSVLRLDARALGKARTRALAAGQPRNRVLPRVQQLLVDALWAQAGERARERGLSDFTDQLLDSTDFTTFLRSWWPPLGAEQVLGWLADPDRLERYAGGTFTRAEVKMLGESWSGASPSVEDVPLLDELRNGLGDVPEDRYEFDPLADLVDANVPEVMTTGDRRSGVRSLAGATEDDGYAHVLVDEAQDLSPMQWRMLGRRGRRASWTVVGDAAQSAWPHPDEAATARAEALRGKDEHAFRLSTNYRNAKEIFALAARVARAAVVDPDLPVAVRESGEQPTQRVVAAPQLAGAVRQATAEALAGVDGTVAVVCATASRPTAQEWLAGLASERLSVLAALDTKGLEFDAVVVVEPADIIAESPTGMRTLYVVLTRATRRLTTVATGHWLP